MKEPKDSLNPQSWIEIAKGDLKRVNILLKAKDAIGAGFYLQQAVEKFLKTFLLKHGWELKKIHQLKTLLEDSLKYDPLLKPFLPLCERVSGYYVIDRYPGVGSSYSVRLEDVKRDLKEAKKLIEALSQ